MKHIYQGKCNIIGEDGSKHKLRALSTKRGCQKGKARPIEAKKIMDIESNVVKYSICIPTTVIDNCNNLEQVTFTAYQIARTAVLFNVQEIIVLDQSKDKKHEKNQDQRRLSLIVYYLPHYYNIL